MPSIQGNEVDSKGSLVGVELAAMSSWEVFMPSVAVAGHWYLLTGNESEVKVEGGRLYDVA